MASVQQSNVVLPTNTRRQSLAAATLLMLGLVVRLVGADSRFLNADECMHYLYSLQPSLLATYHASLHTAHPPLLIVLLHYWGRISGDEFFLRLPSVLAGTAAGLFLYLWLKRVLDACTALIAMAVFLFSPALIYLSFELRQYAFLLLFTSAELYFFDGAVMDGSAGLMLSSIGALYLALLTHYSALIFAATAGLYGILRLLSVKPNRAVIALWVVGQVGVVGLAAFLWRTHILAIREVGMVQHVAESYLRGSLYQRGDENPLAFVARANIRLFKFLFSQGAMGVAGLVLFAAGVFLLLWQLRAAPERRPNTVLDEDRKPLFWQLGALFLAPFVLNCAAALADAYPYGGSRHNSYLALFAFPAIAFAITKWPVQNNWAKPAVVVAALAICNFTVQPAGAYVRGKDQKRKLMRAAVEYVHQSAPTGSIVVADYESGLLLGNYVCHKNVVQTAPPFQLFLISDCSNYTAATLLPPLWVFRANTFPEQMTELRKILTANHLDSGRELWLFQAGYIVDREPEFRSLLAQYGCPEPKQFGANIIVCKLTMATQNQ